MIPDFKTYIKESIWSDIQDRSAGDTVRKEDDINLLDIKELCEYLKTIYKTDSDNDIRVLEIEDDHQIELYLVICLYQDEKGYYRFIYYDGNYINTQLDVIETLGCRSEFERKFSTTKGVNDFDVVCIDVYPKDRARVPVTNKFFIEVLDFILDRIDAPLEQQIEKISNIKESIWSDIQDRSSGETVRKEDDIDNLDFNEFVEYLKNTYEIVETTGFFAIGEYQTPGTDIMNISLPIEKNDNKETPNLSNRMFLIQYIHGDLFMKPNKYFFRLYPRELQKTFEDKYELDPSELEIIPKRGVEVTNSMCVEVIDRLLGMVENPILKKK